MGDPPQSMFIREEVSSVTEANMVNTGDVRGIITEPHLLTSDQTSLRRQVNLRDSTTATKS